MYINRTMIRSTEYVQWHSYCSLEIETNFTICCLASYKLAELLLYTRIRNYSELFFVARSRGKDDGDTRQTLWNDFTRKLCFRDSNEFVCVPLFAGIRTILLRIPNPSCPTLYRGSIQIISSPFSTLFLLYIYPIQIFFFFFTFLFFFTPALKVKIRSIYFFFPPNDSLEQSKTYIYV